MLLKWLLTCQRRWKTQMIKTCLSKHEHTELTYYSESSGDMVFKCHVNKQVGPDDLDLMLAEIKRICNETAAVAPDDIST